MGLTDIEGVMREHYEGEVSPESPSTVPNVFVTTPIHN